MCGRKDQMMSTDWSVLGRQSRWKGRKMGSVRGKKKCKRKCTARNDRDQDEGSGMEAVRGYGGPSIDSAIPRLDKGRIFSSIKSATILRIKLLLCLKFWRQ